jgi:NAD-dependent DNA ligase
VLAGKTVVVTGTLVNYQRKDVEKLITDLGGKAGSGVSKNTDYVIAGSDAGSKLDRAKELNVPVLSEADFEKMLTDLRAGPSARPPAPAPASAPVGDVLAGKTIVVTGTLMRYQRKDIEALITRLGGKAGSSVTKATTHLVCGEAAGSKLDKARAMGIPILSEDEFEKMIGKA